ncbi:MAG: lipoyl synthase [Candidatus Hydrogenedentes bacterium]|nr:lipoyl synthase [Candidatus Hydrogenedentota bacterium]
MSAPVKVFPAWIRRAWPSGAAFAEVKALLSGLELHTVCQSAHCPNHSECWGRRTATLMVLGNVCSRHCTYCAVHSGKPEALDQAEPDKVAEAVARLGLKHTVITSVTRDDLPDGGADHIGRCIEAIKERCPETTIEVLVQDFNGDRAAIARVLAAGAEVFSHNIETVERLHPRMRDRRFSYRGSLQVLKTARELAPERILKSALMLGCGETEADIVACLKDLLEHDCDAVSLGQYLQPTPKHHEVVSFLPPEEFQRYERIAYDLGFNFAVAGPFVRSSYRSEELLDAPFARARLSAAPSVARASSPAPQESAHEN